MKVAWTWWRRGNEDEDDVNPNVFWIKLTERTKTCNRTKVKTLLEKAKLARESSDGKNKIPHKFLGRKI